MRIFILEDDPMRMLHFREELFQHDITHATACEEVGLFQPTYDYIFLDHDLGGRQMDEHEDSGMNFLRMIMDKVGEAMLVIHSYNGPAASRMAREYDARTGHIAVVAPFRGGVFNNVMYAIKGYVGVRSVTPPEAVQAMEETS